MEDQIKVTINAPGLKKLQEGIDQYNQALSDLGNSLSQSYGTSNIGSATAIGIAFGAINIAADVVLTMVGLGGLGGGRSLGEIAEVSPGYYWEDIWMSPENPFAIGVIPSPEFPELEHGVIDLMKLSKLGGN
jgi:hypothetical protein